MDKEKQYQQQTRIICINESENYKAPTKEIRNLEEIFIIEDRNLQEINLKIKKLVKLKKLILYSNGLTKIPNLTKATFLEVLFLADNKISSIEGLEHLHFLKELNLGKNEIFSINCRLDKNVKLEVVNLSANPIKYLRNISNLFQVTSLRKLYLSDPMYGACPITHQFSHYRLQIMHSMPSLKELDGFQIESTDNKLAQKYVNNFLLQYESQYQQLKSKLKYEEEKILKSYLKERETFGQLQKSYMRRIIKSTSTILESRDKVLKHGIANFKTQFSDTLKDYKQRMRLQETQFIIEKESFPNIEIKLNPDIKKTFKNLLKSSLCRSNDKRSVFKDITIINVSFLGSRKEKNYEYEHEKNIENCKFYLLKCPFKVANLNEWQEILSHDFLFYETQNIIVTNCLISCETEYLNNVQQNYMRPPCKETRVATLVKILSEENIVSLKIVPDHLGGDGDTSSCQELCLCSDDCIYYAVEFQYELKDKFELIRDMSSLKKDLQYPRESEKPISFTLSDIERNLTSISICGCNIQKFGNVKEVFTNVMTLDVSFNELTAVNPLLTMFPNLRKLNISHNLLSQLRATKSFHSIEILDISWNLLSSFLDTTQFLSISMRNLKKIKMEFNPIEDVLDEGTQAYFIKGLFQYLQQFNHISLSNVKIKDVKITDKPNEEEILVNISDLKDQHFLTTLGLVNKLENHVCPQHLIKFNNTCDELDGLCLKPAAPVRNMNIATARIRWLSVRHNYLSNLIFGMAMTNLSEIYLSHNRIKDINFNFDLIPNLKKLDLSYNLIHNLIPFRNATLRNLTHLNISGNFIENLHEISQLSSIEQLYVSWNKIKEDLNNLRRINTLIHLKSIDITENPLNKIPNVKYFILQNYPLIQYINGEEIKFDNDLQVYEFQTTTLDLSYLLKTYERIVVSNLTKLTISDVSLKRLELTKDVAPNLLSVNLERNEIEYICNMCNLPLLKTLRLSYNKIKGFLVDKNSDEEKQVFDTLETLYLDHNEIEAVDAFNLSAFHNLKYLLLHSNKISDLRGLEETHKLRVLVLDTNEITEIPTMFFVKYKFLNHLFLESNKLTDLKFARNIVSPLAKIFLGHNRIKDFHTVEHLKSLKHLREATLLGNNISWKSEYYNKVLPILEHVQYLDGHRIQDVSSNQ